MSRHKEILLGIQISFTGTASLTDVLEQEYTAIERIEAPTMNDALEIVRSLDTDRLETLRYIGGHGVRYGLHKLIPHPCRYVTLLRDPTAHRMSTYHFRKGKFPASLEAFHPQISPEVFAEAGIDQSNFVSWLQPYLDFGERMTPEATVEWILQSFTRDYALVGITELFDESVFLLGLRLGWSNIPFWSLFADNQKRPPLEATAPDVLNKLKNRELLDYRLYNTARDVILKEIDALSPESRAKLTEYRRKRELFGSLRRDHQTMRPEFIRALVEGPRRVVTVLGSDWSHEAVKLLEKTGQKILGSAGPSIARRGSEMKISFPGITDQMLDQTELFVLTDVRDYYTKKALLMAGIPVERIIYASRD